MTKKVKTTKQSWILLIHQLPPKPTNLRVRIWRKLQKLGAVAIKNSVYVLPADEKTHEDFHELLRKTGENKPSAQVRRVSRKRRPSKARRLGKGT